MKIDHKIKQSLFDLAKSILRNRNSTEVEPIWPPRYGKIPDDVNRSDVEHGFILIKSKEDYSHYRHCLGLLRGEDSLNYISSSELDKELWHFYCELYCDPTSFVNDSSIKAALNSLLDRLNKPLIEYEVLISLEKHLRLNGRSIELAGVKFVEMNDAEILAWGISKDSTLFHQKFYEIVAGHAVALILEQCHGTDKAVENAKIKLNTALNVLRVTLLLDHDPRIVDWRIHDNQMLFGADEQYAVREKGDSSSASIGFQSGFRSWEFIVDDVYSRQITESKQIVDSLFIPINAQNKIYERMRRALEWIGGSVIRERLDDKIVDICTALETLLATKQDRRKGEAIALRMMLLYSRLNKSFFDPMKLLEIYEKRSDIVHGSERDICLDSDYKVSQWMALDVLTNVLAYINKYEITQHSDFFKDLESDFVLIEKSVDLWKSHPNYKGIVETASEMVKRRFLRDAS
jgi:hypothetical protein